MPKNNPIIEPEHPDETSKICPNCASPLVIRNDIWVCFTCNFEEKVQNTQ